MTEEITVEQALETLDRISKEWVEKDLDKGIPISFRYWRGGRHKEFLARLLWQNIVVPCIFGLIVFTCAMMKEWKVFVILLIGYIIYWIIGTLFYRREKGNLVIKTDGITVITPRDKTFITWDAVVDVCSSIDESTASEEMAGTHQENTKYRNVYELVILTQTKRYSFYDVYWGAMAKDSQGRISPAMMPLHVAYKLMKTAYRKVKSI